ncbi:hypothetical protein [Candidatus Solincola sp.]|nr:hypothetical protein [Actinomycetota bacterium]MDI7251996.1 hypothetical protein [Actinomycetota bacterium]
MISRKCLLLVLGALASAAVVALLLVRGPGGTGGDSRNDAAHREAQEEPPASEGEVESSGPEQGAREGGGFSVVPEGEGESQAVVISFPDPLSWEEAAPVEELSGICGRWVLEMEGEPFTLKNCHLLLGEDGGIALPPDYIGVIKLMDGRYAWDAGSGSFRAQADLVLKTGPGTGQVPLRLNLEGTVSVSRREITGSYQAIPGGEAYAPYAQQGGFLLRR